MVLVRSDRTYEDRMQERLDCRESGESDAEAAGRDGGGLHGVPRLASMSVQMHLVAAGSAREVWAASNHG